MTYRCVATTVAGFVQQLAVCYVARGYIFYVTGTIPDHKDPVDTDRKIIGQYGIDASKWTRSRRKKAGLASVQYLRYGRFYVILANHGDHPFFAAEKKRLRDIRENPIRFRGYSISLHRARGGGSWHASVRIEKARFLDLKDAFAQMAVHRPAECLWHEFRIIPFEHYAPVRNQLYMLLRMVNRKRKAAGLELLPYAAVWQPRFTVRPFD